MSLWIDDLLNEWRLWALRGNMPKLGYAMSAYAERVGDGAWSSPEPDDTADCVKLDDLIRVKLTPIMSRVIWLHYIDPRPTKQKYGTGGKPAYYAKLGMAKAALQELWEAETDNAIDA